MDSLVSDNVLAGKYEWVTIRMAGLGGTCTRIGAQDFRLIGLRTLYIISTAHFPEKYVCIRKEEAKVESL